MNEESNNTKKRALPDELAEAIHEGIDTHADLQEQQIEQLTRIANHTRDDGFQEAVVEALRGIKDATGGSGGLCSSDFEGLEKGIERCADALEGICVYLEEIVEHMGKKSGKKRKSK